MTRQLDLVAFGDVAVDHYFKVETVPAPGEKVEALFAGSFAGGMGGNVAAAAASTGVECAVVSRVGSDHWGPKLRHELSERGISVEWVTSDDAPTGQSVIQLLPDGERSILVAVRHGGELQLADRVLSASPRLVYLAPSMLREAARLAKECQQRSVRVATDIEPYAFARDSSAAIELVAHCDLVVTNRALASQLPPRRNREVRVVLCGADGLSVEADGGKWRGSARTDPHVVDTTGAGDAAVGAACAAFLEGLDVDGIGGEALRASSECVTRLGARYPFV